MTKNTDTPAPYKIAASRADRETVCAGSIPKPSVDIRDDSAPARLGQAAHLACSGVVDQMSNDVEDPERLDLTRVADRFDVDVDDLAPLVVYARRAWGELRRFFSKPITEQFFEGPVSRGRFDVGSIVGGSRVSAIVVGDFKSGRVQSEHPGQLLATADALRDMHGFPTSGYVTAFEIWLRFGEYRTHRFSLDRLEGWRERAADKIKHAGERYTPGGHCGFCNRRFDPCAARERYLLEGAGAVGEVSNALAVDITPEGRDAVLRERAGSVWDKSRELKRVLAHFEDVVKELLGEGPIDLGDGRRLEHVKKSKAVIDPQKAWGVLEALGFSEDEIASTLSMSKGRIEKVVRAKLGDKPPRGSVGKSKAAAMDGLREADAVSMSTWFEAKILSD